MDLVKELKLEMLMSESKEIQLENGIYKSSTDYGEQFFRDEYNKQQGYTNGLLRAIELVNSYKRQES
jgi:hypothetical protein